MPKFLVQGTYTQEGLKGLLKEGGSKRRQATEEWARSVGVTIEAYYFAFGDYDFYLIYDAPDQATVIASSLVGNSSGSIAVKTVVLITPEEMDEAVQKKVTYRPPGHD